MEVDLRFTKLTSPLLCPVNNLVSSEKTEDTQYVVEFVKLCFNATKQERQGKFNCRVGGWRKIYRMDL